MKKFFLIITVCFLYLSAVAQRETNSSLTKYYKVIVQTLAHDSMQGRLPGTAFEKTAADFIAREFDKIGLTPVFQKFSFHLSDSSSLTESINVYSFIDNKKDSTIIIGAHYDHLGLGGPLSRSLGKNGIHNGADDNASGVALMLGLAKEYKSWSNPNYNYVYVAYSAHEMGLYGSGAFAKLASKKFKNLALVANFDMVGRMHPSLRWVKLTGVENTFENSENLQATIGLKFRLEPDTLLNQLDTRAFYKDGIPCIAVSTGIHDDYHKLTDDESNINYEGILLIQKWLREYLEDIGK